MALSELGYPTAEDRTGRADSGARLWHRLAHVPAYFFVVAQELLRHADIRTTMNIYTQAMTDQKRQAHSRIVRSVLAKPSELGAPED